jgi:hypothetical protein
MSNFEQALDIVDAFCDYLEARASKPVPLLYRVSELPHSPWTVRWAILTYLRMAKDKPDSFISIYGSLKVAWAVVEQYCSDADCDRAAQAQFAPQGSIENSWFQTAQNHAARRYTSAFRSFDDVASEVAGHEFVEKSLRPVVDKLRQGIEHMKTQA